MDSARARLAVQYAAVLSVFLFFAVPTPGQEAAGSPSWDSSALGEYYDSDGLRLLLFQVALGPAFLDYRTGRMAILRPAGADTLTAGPGAVAAEPVEDVIVLRREREGRVTGLGYTRLGAPEVALRRREARASRDIAIAHEDVRLAATLTLPDRACPCPAIVLLHGGGPTTRSDVVAWPGFLAEQGLAVLVYDKRGSGETTGPDWHTFEDLASDAVAAVRWLREQPEVDVGRVGFWVYSQGGWVAALALDDARPDFVLTVTTPAVSAAEQAPEWARASLAASGFPSEEIDAAVTFTRAVNAFGRGDMAWDDYSRLLESARAATWFDRVEKPTDREAPTRPFYASSEGRYYDPIEDWTAYRGPVLALFGALDTTVPSAQSAGRLADALAEDPLASVVILPGASHALLRAVTGSPEEPLVSQGAHPAMYRLMEDFLRRIARP